MNPTGNAQEHATPAEVAARWSIRAALVLVPLTFAPGLMDFFLLPKLMVLQICLVPPITLWALGLGPPNWRTSGSNFPLTVFIFVMSLSAFWAGNPFRSTSDLSKHVTFFAVYLCCSQLLSRRDVVPILAAFCVGALAVSALGVIENSEIVKIPVYSAGPPSATFGNRNIAAGYLAVGMPLAVAYFLLGRNRPGQVLAAAAVTLMASLLLYTRSRGSWIGVFVGFAAALGATKLSGHPIGPRSILRRLGGFRARLAAIGTVTVILLAQVPPTFATSPSVSVKGGIASTLDSVARKDFSINARLAMWRASLSMIYDRPWLGFGLGNWEYHFPAYDRAGLNLHNRVAHRPHNDFLWFFAETGIVGLASYLVFLVSLIRLGMKLLRLPAGGDHAMGFGLIASAVAFSGVSFFSFPSERIPASMIFWISAGMLIVATSENRRFSSLSEGWFPPTRTLFAAVLLLATGITIQHLRFEYHFRAAFERNDTTDVVGFGDHALKALDIGPFDYQIFTFLGDWAKARGDLDEAEYYHRRTLDYNPNFANAYDAIGQVLHRRGRREEAMDYYRNALSLSPRHRPASYHAGLVYHERGDLDSAMVAYRKSGQTKALINLGAAYIEKGEPDSAEATLKQAVGRTDAPPEAWYNLADLYLDQHRYLETLDAVKGLHAAPKPDSTMSENARKAEAEAWFGIGSQAAAAGRSQEAMRSYERAVDIAPEFNAAWRELGGARAALGDTAGAISAYERFASQLPGDPALGDYYLGGVYESLGLSARSRASFDRFIRAWSGTPSLTAKAEAAMQRLEEGD